MTASVPPLNVYVHWPYCTHICPYCDFNVYRQKSVPDYTAWKTAFIQEIDYYASIRATGVIETVFFGGGTPSLMPPELCADILYALDRKWGMAEDAEITLEANPNDIDDARMRALHAAGITRLSLGVQSFSDAALRFLERDHDAAKARAAFLCAQNVFPVVSLDLIYAQPHQTLALWEEDLQNALALHPQHMSLYQLTIEQKTRFAKDVRRGKWMPPDEDKVADLYILTQDICAAHHMPAYEISNHARDGFYCRHNLSLWRGGDYIGLGPGAHGRLSTTQGRMATQNETHPALWRKKIETSGHAMVVQEHLDAYHLSAEALMLGLRLCEGVHRTRVEHINKENLMRLCKEGLLAQSQTHIYATARGRLLLDYIISALLL